MKFACWIRPSDRAFWMPSQAGAWAIGWEQDQAEVQKEAARRILVSVTPDAGPILYRALVVIPAGPPPASLVGNFRLSPYHEAETFVPADLQQELLNLNAALQNGGISTGVKPEEGQ